MAISDDVFFGLPQHRSTC